MAFNIRDEQLVEEVRQLAALTGESMTIVAQEPGFESLLDAVLDDPAPVISAANALEAAIVVDREKDPILSRGLDRARAELGIATAPVTDDFARTDIESADRWRGAQQCGMVAHGRFA